MRILILTQFYPPEPTVLPHEVAKEMIKLGHQVTVVTGFPNYPEGRIYKGYKQKLYQRESFEGVEIYRLPLYPNHSASIIKRAVSYLSFAISATLLSPIFVKSVDVIFVYHTLTAAIPAIWLGFLRRAPFIFNIQDLYPEAITAIKSISDKNFIYKVIGKFSYYIYNKSFFLSVISDGFKNKLIEKGIASEKIEVIPSWVDETIYRPMPEDEELAAKSGLVNHFNILFAGNIGPAQGLNSVLDSASLLIDIKDIQFVFIGEGVAKGDLIREAHLRKLSNVVFLPRQPAILMPKYYALADVLFVHLMPLPLFELTIPLKTYSYLACGKPILMAVKGDAGVLVQKANAGLLACPSDPQDIADAVKRLYYMPSEERQALGNNGRVYYLKNLRMEVAGKKYEELFVKTVSRFRDNKM